MKNNIDLAYENLKKSPMFKLSLSSKELFHSNFLEWLSNVDQDAFKKLILKMAGIAEKSYRWPDVWRVKREYNNFDLCIVAYDQYNKKNEDERIDDDDDFRILFVIENKVKSIPYKEQLERYSQEAAEKNKAYWKNRANDLLKEKDFDSSKKYWIGIDNGKWVLKQDVVSGRGKKTNWSKTDNLDYAFHDEEGGRSTKTKFIEHYVRRRLKCNSQSINYILLSLAKTFPNYDGKNDWIIKETNWKVCNYGSYQSIITTAFKRITQGLNSQIIEDYCGFIKSLTELSAESAKDYEEQNQDTKNFLYADNDNYNKAHQFRIHDLYQKLKFSYLCTQLFNKVRDKYGNSYTVFPSNQGGLFKDKNTEFKPHMNYICVNYTYIHGEPLLEINVHPEKKCDKELYYAIQVQGVAYEHGIQVKKNEATIKKLKRNQEKIFSEMVWNRLNDKSICIIPNWMNIKNVSKWQATRWMDMPSKENKEYNKYDMNDGTYVYQKYIIKNEAKIKEVLDQMLCDLEQIIKSI